MKKKTCDEMIKTRIRSLLRVSELHFHEFFIQIFNERNDLMCIFMCICIYVCHMVYMCGDMREIAIYVFLVS